MLREPENRMAKKKRKAQKTNSNLQAPMISNRLLASLLVFAALIAIPFLVVQGQGSDEDQRSELEAELEAIQKEIEEYESTIRQTQAKRQTLENQLAIINSRIEKINLEIYQTNVRISDLEQRIRSTETAIAETEQEIEDTQEQLSELLQVMYQENQKTPLEIVMSGSDLSDFFHNIAALELLNVRNNDILDEFLALEAQLKEQREQLEDEKQESEDLARIQVLQRQESREAQNEQSRLVSQTRGEEQRYQNILEDKQQTASEIRQRLLNLVGVSDSPTFGEALEVAQWVQQHTGIRPALLLAIITQESRLGRNVGQCTINSTSSGTSVGLNGGGPYSNGIHPSRDLQPFLQITREVGRDPMQTPISCPIPGIAGYGGAMGPAQFIPSTWMMYKNQAASILGKPADPWKVRDSFLASGLLLRDNGAAPGTYSAEFCAALRYFSGSCSARNQQAYGFYANQVLQRANCVQDFVDNGSVSAQCSNLLFIPQ